MLTALTLLAVLIAIPGINYVSNRCFNNTRYERQQWQKNAKHNRP